MYNVNISRVFTFINTLGAVFCVKRVLLHCILLSHTASKTLLDNHYASPKNGIQVFYFVIKYLSLPHLQTAIIACTCTLLLYW